MLSEEEAGEIEKFMLAHQDLILLSDEIYEKIVFDGARHISPGAMESIHDRVVTANGFSKSMAMTGWRLGYMTAPREILAPAYKLYQHSISCVSGFVQKAAVVALDCEEEVEKMRREYQRRRDVFTSMLNAIDGIRVRPAEGAFYAWVHLDKKGMHSGEICRYLLEEAKVVGVPGESFGEAGSGCIRFSFANDMENLKEAAGRIRTSMEKL